MLNIFEKKPFFYFSTLFAILISLFLLFFAEKNNAATPPFSILAQIFTVIALFFLLIFFSNQHKELSKVMLTTILVISLLNYAMDLFYVSYVIKSLPTIIKAVQMNSGDAISKILPNTLLPVITYLVLLVITLLVYINHCSINFTNNTSFMGVNFNQILIILLFIFIISNKIIQIYVLKMPISIRSILANFDGFFILLSVISTESFINKMRAKRAQNK